jgi:hypothetical protein
MSATWTYILVIVALAVIATLSIKSCSEKKQINAPSYTERQIDSVLHVQEESEKILHQLLVDKNRIESTKDSLSMAIAMTATKLEIQTLKAAVAVKEAKLAKEKLANQEGEKDYSEYVRACDSLIPQVDSLINIVGQARGEVLAVRNSYDSLLSNNSLQIARLEFDRDFYKEKFDKVSVHSLELEGENKKLDKKAGKRFGFGPFVGATYADEKIKPTAGVGLHYDIFRF